MELAFVRMELLTFMAIILLIFNGRSTMGILLALVSLSMKEVDVHGLQKMVLYKIPPARKNGSSISRLRRTKIMRKQRQRNKTSRCCWVNRNKIRKENKNWWPQKERYNWKQPGSLATMLLLYQRAQCSLFDNL